MSNFIIGFLTGAIVYSLLRPYIAADKKTTIVLPDDPADYWKPENWTPEDGNDNEK